MAILNRDIKGLGKAMTGTIRAWKKILPLTMPDDILKELEDRYFPFYPGAVTSGSGGGYVIVVSDKPVDKAIKVRIRY